MTPVFFAKPADLRKWFEKNYKKEQELLVGYYKKSTGKPSITWSESVDEALCFGWIDGIRRSIDAESYSIRFTPRRSRSIWSLVNTRKMSELIGKGLVLPEGLAAFEKRNEERSKIYSYENEAVELSPDFEKKFKADKKAWESFTAMAPSYRKAAVRWVMTAKQEATRLSRLATLIEDSQAGRKIKPLSYDKRK